MEQVNPTDWSRIFAGDAPPIFYLELVIRALFMYALLMTSMRLLGKRMSTQISRVEMAAMVAFASAIGVPLLSPSNGILPSVIIAIIIVGITKIIASISYKSERFEEATQGDIDCLVVDSVMDLKMMQRVRITRERLFAQLRSECATHLGMIKRVYLEAGGTFTVITNDNPQPGLLVLPESDTEFVNEMVKVTDVTICKECGEKKPQKAGKDEDVNCANCGANDWVKAVIAA